MPSEIRLISSLVSASAKISASGNTDAGSSAFEHAEAVQHARHVRPHLDAVADLAEFGRLFQHAHLAALLRQGERRREPADAAACDQDLASAHGYALFSAFGFSGRRLMLFVRCFCAAIALRLSLAAQAQVYPAKQLRLVVPYPAGGGTDFFARTVGAQLAVQLGQPVVIENRPGAATIIGAEAVAKSRAGRLHAAARRHRDLRGQPVALQEAALRPEQGPDAGDDDRAFRAAPRRQSRRS